MQGTTVSPGDSLLGPSRTPQKKVATVTSEYLQVNNAYPLFNKLLQKASMEI